MYKVKLILSNEKLRKDKCVTFFCDYNLKRKPSCCRGTHCPDYFKGELKNERKT